jgi:1-acyl-sn-glycerol-3-phosphate acyltransferase
MPKKPDGDTPSANNQPPARSASNDHGTIPEVVPEAVIEVMGETMPETVDDGVPDAAELPPDWQASDDDLYDRSDDDFFLGGEAAVPPGEYGPPIMSDLPDPRAITREIRELERRVRALVTPAFPIEHRRRLPLEFLWKRYRTLAMRGRSARVDDFGRDPIYTGRIEPMLDFLYKRYFRADVKGVEHVPGTGPAIVVANHSGALPFDGLVLMHVLRREHPARREARPLIEDFLFHFPYLGTFINRVGGVRACPENAERLLDSGQVVIAFPEGAKGTSKLYRDRYKLQRFGRGGFIKLALRTRSPIVPTAIVGAEEAQPMLGKITWLAKSVGIPYVPITPTFPWLGPLGLAPLPAKWFLCFGPPMDLAAEYGPEAADDRLLVGRLAENVRATIQDMVDDILARRRSVVFG